MSAQLRVLHVGPTPFFSDRGCHIRIRGLVRALSEVGVESLLCTYHHGDEVDGVTTVRIPRVPGYTRVDAGPSPFKYLADALLFFTTLRAALRFRPQVIHGHLHEGALIGEVVRRLLFWRRMVLVFDVQGSLVGELEEHGYFRWLWPLRPLFAAVEWLIDHAADALACSSTASLEIARDRFGVPPSRLHLVPDGADVRPPAIGEPNRLRADLGLPPDVPVVVYTGSLLPVKGLDALLDAVAAALAARSDLHFLIVGYPEREAERWLRERGLLERVTLTGRVPFDRIGHWLGAAEVALEPKPAAAGEASGTLLNYMAAGLPTVAFDTPNNRAILGGAGCYAEDRSGAGLAAALDELLAAPSRRAALGEAARERAASTFSWQASAATLLSIYRSLSGRAVDP